MEWRVLGPGRNVTRYFITPERPAQLQLISHVVGKVTPRLLAPSYGEIAGIFKP